MRRHLMITGKPGSGKTTLIQRALENISKKFELNEIACGFYTEEVKSYNGRIGFDVVSINNRDKRAPLARIDHENRDRKPLIGKYAVDSKSFESIAFDELNSMHKSHLIVIDEIGKMEFFSRNFITLVRNALNLEDAIVFGVLPKFRQIQTSSGEKPELVQGRYFVEEIKSRNDVDVIELEPKSRETCTSYASGELEARLITLFKNNIKTAI